MFASVRLVLSTCTGGEDAIDTDALRRWRRDSTLSEDAQGNENAIDWFWQSLDLMSQEERGKVLAFATGCPRMPLGPDGPTFVLNLHPHEDPDALPTAHTCTNTINLPPYPSQVRALPQRASDEWVRAETETRTPQLRH
jgi:hypothetical protein